MPTAMIVDPHTAFAELLASFLSSRFGIDVVAIAATPAAAGDACTRYRPQIVFVGVDGGIDPTEARGVALARKLVASNPSCTAFMLAVGGAGSRVHGGHALPRQVRAVIDVSAGWQGIAREMSELLEPAGQLPLRAKSILSPREFDVFRQIGQGMSTAKISVALGIGMQTVETHRKNVTRKLGVTGAALVRAAVLDALDPAGGPWRETAPGQS